MAERFKAPVLKTGDAARHRGFESLSLRQNLEKYPSGRRGSPAKGVGLLKGARVQIPASPPEDPLTDVSGFFYCIDWGNEENDRAMIHRRGRSE